MPKWNACKYSLTCNVLILRLAYKILAFVYVFMEICFWWDKKIPFPLPSLVKAVTFFTMCREGHLLYFFEYNFLVKPSVCELLLWLLMSVSLWCMTMSRFFICVMPGKVLAKGVDTLYYGKNKPCRYNDYFLILIWWWLIFCYLCKTKFWKNGTKGINICFNVFGC